MFREQLFVFFLRPTETFLQEGVKIDTNSNLEYRSISGESEDDIEVVADNLQIPWGIAFLPGGDMLTTERAGTLRRIGEEGGMYVIEGVEHTGEGGLLGIALHPQFSENQWMYLYLTTKTEDGLINRVERYRFKGDELSEKTIIINNIPGALYHDGGRISFGPDGYLYITVGDAGKSGRAQDTNSLSGKILRLSDDGSIPSDNPFGNAVYSYGHRNPQGLAWDAAGQLWATEHGSFGFDELNLIKKGKNYGWPEVRGDETRFGMEPPAVHSGRDETWAPTGMAYVNGSLFFGGLRGESLYEARILEGSKVSLISHFRLDFGRIRAVVLGPDNYVYISTSNTDGRGSPNPDDDKIIRINPAIFEE